MYHNVLTTLTGYLSMSCCSPFLDHPLAVGLDGGLMGFFFYFLIVLEAFWVGSSFVTFLSRVVPHVMLGYTNVV